MLRKIYHKLTYPPYRPIWLFMLAAFLFIMPFAALAAPLWQELPPPPGDDPVSTIIMYAVTALLGLLGTGLTQWLKTKLNITATAALLMSYGVALILAILQLFFLGWFAPDLLTSENIPAIFTAIVTSATFWFEVLVKRKKEAKG